MNSHQEVNNVEHQKKKNSATQWNISACFLLFQRNIVTRCRGSLRSLDLLDCLQCLVSFFSPHKTDTNVCFQALRAVFSPHKEIANLCLSAEHNQTLS